MRRKKSYKRPNEFHCSGQEVLYKKAISDGFNNFFTNIDLMLAKQIEHCYNTSVPDFMSNSVHIYLFLEQLLMKKLNILHPIKKINNLVIIMVSICLLLSL